MGRFSLTSIIIREIIFETKIFLNPPAPPNKKKTLKKLSTYFIYAWLCKCYDL